MLMNCLAVKFGILLSRMFLRFFDNKIQKLKFPYCDNKFKRFNRVNIKILDRNAMPSKFVTRFCNNIKEIIIKNNS